MPWTALPFTASSTMMPYAHMLISAPSLGRSFNRDGAVAATVQQNNAARRSANTSIVLIPTACALRVGPISNSIVTAVVFALHCFGYVAVRLIGRRRTADNRSGSYHLSNWLPVEWIVACRRIVSAAAQCSVTSLVGHWSDKRRYTFECRAIAFFA